jgi:hypothetical protein
MAHPNRIFASEAELYTALREWDRKFNHLMKTKGKGKKFEDVDLRPPYTHDLKKKDFKNKKWT